MHRKECSRHFGKRGSGNKGRKGNKDDESVHRRNLHVFAQPVVFLFNLLGFLAYNFWLLICSTAQALPQKAKQTTGAAKDSDSVSDTSSQRDAPPVLQGTAMFPYTYEIAEKPPPVGPAEPALAKQKHHHRKAFEYISKALKIDEEEKGTVFGK